MTDAECEKVHQRVITAMRKHRQTCKDKDDHVQALDLIEISRKIWAEVYTNA